MAKHHKGKKSPKTALKRLRKTNPKGNRKPKLRYQQSAVHHMRTKKSTRAKRRKSSRKEVYKGTVNKIKKVVSL